jgi:hypothetical protein
VKSSTQETRTLPSVYYFISSQIGVEHGFANPSKEGQNMILD